MLWPKTFFSRLINFKLVFALIASFIAILFISFWYVTVAMASTALNLAQILVQSKAP